MSNKPLCLALILALAGSAACKKKDAPAAGGSTPAASGSTAAGATSTPAPTPPAAPPVPVPPKPVPENLPPVLARVNNEDVKKSDFDLLINNLRAQNQNRPIPPERRDEIFRGVLDQLVVYTLLKQEAKARNIVVDAAEVEQQIEEMRKQAGGDANFKKAMKAQGMTIERLRSDAQTQMAIAKMMNAQVASTAAATDAEAKDFYDKNPDKFKRPESVRASHILIGVKKDATDAEKAQARARIEQVLKRAKAGEDFAVLAREHSQDSSAAQGGDLNYFVKGQMVQPFDQVAFALKPNEISDVVTTEFGYHVIKVVDHKPAGTVPIEDVSANIKEFLTKQKQQQTAEAFVTQLKQKSKVEVLI
ncbi:MAG TPA: peptidylprolyl isomerase [Vicinamibacterales bacterium]|nr:peptidylprolyl isomerase [Vicinamibacterales bacterium]